MYVCVYVCMYVCMCVCMYVCVYVCVCVHVCSACKQEARAVSGGVNCLLQFHWLMFKFKCHMINCNLDDFFGISYERMFNNVTFKMTACGVFVGF
jgi:hypothetical protein